ncbi:MAG: rod shape-determining protein MreD [Vicinamibacterales bacterium]|jgi:rod shape-determining protein MreD|nr:rod shape-determining protein MreD [Vicinamibacterales bacterium]
MTALRMAALVVAAVLLQGALSRSGGGAPGDLVLVAVVAVGLLHGRLAGLLTGTAAGLLQDALGGGMLGVSGLGKCVAGYLAGVAGTQFIVTQWMSRGFLFLGASLLNSASFMGLSALLGLRRYDNPALEVVTQAAVNAAAGVLLFYVIEFMPTIREQWSAVLERRRKRRYH